MIRNPSVAEARLLDFAEANLSTATILSHLPLVVRSELHSQMITP